MRKIWFLFLSLWTVSPACVASSPVDAFDIPFARRPVFNSTTASIVISKIIFEQAEKKAKSLEDTQTTPNDEKIPVPIVETPSHKAVLKLKKPWQETFYSCHHAGHQNFLFLMRNQSILEEFAFALSRLANPELPSLYAVRLMVAAPSNLHEELTYYFKTHVFNPKKRSIAFNTRDLHFCSSRFFEDPKSNSLTSLALNNEKYTCIFTNEDCVSKLTPLLHIKQGVIYISYQGNKDRIMLLLKAEDFKERNIIVGDKVICAMRSDPRDYVRSSLHPAYTGESNSIPFDPKSAKDSYLKSQPSTPCQALGCPMNDH